MSTITGKVAVVTGAASGIGLATAESLVKEGAKVLLVDLNPKVNEEAARLGQAAFVGDLTHERTRRQMIRRAEKAYGMPPTIGVFAAGINLDGFAVKKPQGGGKTALLSLANFKRVLEVNLIAPYYSALELVCRLLDAGGAGQSAYNGDGVPNAIIVFVGSIVAQGNGGQSNYAASKAGLRGIVETLDQEWRSRYGVHVAVVHPGFVDTAMTRKLPSNVLAKQVARTVSGKLHSAESVAFAICNVIKYPQPDEHEFFLDRFLHLAMEDERRRA